MYLRFIQSFSYERLACLFRDLFGLGVSEGAQHNMLRRAKPRFDKEVEAILARRRELVELGFPARRQHTARHRGHGIVAEVLGGHRSSAQ